MTQSERRLTLTLEAKTIGQQQIQAMGDDLRGVQTILAQLKRDAQGTGLLTGAASSAREQARLAQAQAAVATAAARQQVAEAKAQKASSDALTASLRAQGAQATVTARLSAQGDQQAAAASRTAYKARQEAIDQVKLSMARLRAGFDDGLVSERAYHAQNQKLIGTIRQMGETAGYSTGQLKQLAIMHGSLAREGNSIAGVVNPAGLSGNVANALSGTLPGLLQGLRGITALSPSLGAAAARVTGVAQALQTVTVASNGVFPQLLTVGRGTNTAAQAAGFLQNGASGASGAVRLLGGTAAVTGAAVGVLTSAVIAGALAVNQAVNEYTAYEFQLAKISTLTDRTKEQLGTVGQAIKELSRETGATMLDLSNSVYDVLGASVKGADDFESSMKLVKVAAHVAEAGFTETAVATDVLTSVLNAYKLSAGDAGMVADKLFKTVDVGKISFRELATSLGMVTSFAATAGVSLDDVLGAIAAMTANGVQGGQAIEYLRTMLGNMVAPSAQARKLAHDLNLEYGEQALKAKGIAGVLRDVEKATGGSAGQLKILLGDVGAVAAASAIATGNFERMDESVRAVSDSAGSADTAYKKVADTAQKQSERVAASWKTLWVNVGEIFLPFKVGFMTAIGEMLESVNTLLEKFNVARGVSGRQAGLAVAQENLRKQQAEAQRLRAEINDPKTLSYTRDNDRVLLPKVEADIRRLRAEIVALQKELGDAQVTKTEYDLNHATGALPAGMQGPQLPGVSKTQAAPVVGEEAGRFGYAFFEQMFKSGSVRGNPNIQAWCADVASQIQKSLGNNIKYTASAGGLKENAIAAGYQKVSAAQARPGDLVFYRDPNVYGGIQPNGRRSGNHVETVARNEGGKVTLFGANNSTTPTFKAFYDPEHATFYRAPTSPFATGGGSGGGTKPTPMVTAEQITRAQELTAALDKAQEALKKDPKSVPLTQAVIAATREMEKFKKASASNAEALSAVQKEGNKSGSTYIATAKDLRTYGAEALRLVKDLETAEKSGDPAQKALVDRRIALWQGESEARKAVFSAEGAAYRVRQQQRDKDDTEDKTRAANRLQTQQALTAALNQGREADARRALASLKSQQQEGLDLAKDDAAKRRQIVDQSGPAIIAAEDRLANLRRDQRVKQAKVDADKAKALPGADLDAIEKTRIATVAQAYKDAAGEREAARTTQARAERTADQEAEKAAEQVRATRLAAERALADGRLTIAKTTAQQVLTNYDDEVKAAGDSATARLAVEQRLGGDVLAARNVVSQTEAREETLRLERERNKAVSETGLTLAQRRGLWAQYAVRIAQVDKTLQATLARNGVGTAIQLDEAWSKVFAEDDAARAQAYAAKVQGYLDRLTDMSPDELLQVYTEAQANRDTTLLGKVFDEWEARREAEEAGLRTLQKAASDGVAEDAVKLAQQLGELGDSDGAMNALQVALGQVMDSAQRGEDAAGAVGQLTQAINDLYATTTETDAFNEFVAGLGGTIDEQIMQVMDRYAGETDVKVKGRLQGLLATLRQQLPDFGNPYAAGLIPGANGFENQTGGSGATLDALTLTDRLSGVGANQIGEGLFAPDVDALMAGVQQARDFLASGVADGLPDSVRQGLQQAVDNAQTYADTLASITGEAVADGASEALKAMPQQPTNLFDEKQAQVFEMDRGGDLLDPTKLAALRAGLEQLRATGALTDADLISLNSTIDDLTSEPEVVVGNLLDLSGWQEDIRNLQDGLDNGTLTLQQAQPIIGTYVEGLVGAAAAADAAGNPRLAQQFRDLAISIKKLTPEAQAAAFKLEQLAGARGAMNDARSGASGLVTGKPEDFDLGWAQQLQYIEEAKAKYPELAAEFDKLIAKGKAFKSLNLAHSFLDSAKQIANGVGQVANLLGEDGVGKAASALGQGFESAQGAAVGIAKVMANPADVGGWVQAITGVVGTIDSLFTAVEALDPAYAKWKKNQQEILALEQEGMGEKKYNSWLTNPYYDQLQQDAANRDKRTNASGLQRWWWGITGGGPQVLSDEAAKDLAAAGAIFNEFGSELGSTFETEMMNAVESGDWDGASENIGKMIDRFTNGLIIRAVLAKSRLSDLAKQFAEAYAKGEDTTNILAQIRSEGDAIVAGLKSNTDLVKGAAEGIFKGLGDDLGSSLEDALLSAWDEGNFDAAGDKMEANLNRFVAQMALKALMATSKMKDLVDAYIKEYEAGGDTTDELAAIKNEQDRLMGAWQGIAPGLAGFGSNPSTTNSSSTSSSDTRSRNELLYRYEHETDPDQREEYRQQLLGLDKSTGGSGTSVTVTSGTSSTTSVADVLARFADRFGIFERAGDIQLQAAQKQDTAADKNLRASENNVQAAGLQLLAAQARTPAGPALPPAGSIPY